ncbi:MAG: TetR/AcrR family transcriptional regulator [Fibrobacterota bacterium]|nr:TetR/AcrR family transcriptional regulator [Fibrobacterota bacterium]
MKVSREKKQEHHQKFIAAFVSEVRAKGYAEVTLRDVGRRAGLSDGAIYKFFPSKEKILLAYYVEKMENLRREGEALAGKSDYSLGEKLQSLLEFQIGQYEGEKDFLEKTFHPTFVAASLMWSEVAAMRKAYLGTVRSCLDVAVAKGELPEPVWTGIVDEMFWCHYIGVMMYWLKDDSENHEDTTQFIDRTLNFLTAVVAGPLLKQAEELVGFLVNRHLMPLMMNLGVPGMGKAENPKPEAAGGKPSGRTSPQVKSAGREEDVKKPRRRKPSTRMDA